MAITVTQLPNGVVQEYDPAWSVPMTPAPAATGILQTPVPNAAVSLRNVSVAPMVQEGVNTLPARPILNRRGPTQVAWAADPVNGSVSPLVGAYSAYPHVVYAPQYLGAAGLLDVVSRAVQNNPYAQQAMMMAAASRPTGGAGGMGGGRGSASAGTGSGTPSAPVQRTPGVTPAGNRGVRARDLDTYSAYDAVSKNLLGPLGDMSSLQANLGTDSDTLSMIADLLQSNDPAIREQAKGLADVAAQQALEDYEQGQHLTRQFYEPGLADASLSRSGDMTNRSLLEGRPTYTDSQAMIEEYRRANMPQETAATQDGSSSVLAQALTGLGLDAGVSAAIAPWIARSQFLRNMGIYSGGNSAYWSKLLSTPAGTGALRSAVRFVLPRVLGASALPILAAMSINKGREMGMNLEDWNTDNLPEDFEPLNIR